MYVLSSDYEFSYTFMQADFVTLNKNLCTAVCCVEGAKKETAYKDIPGVRVLQ